MVVTIETNLKKCMNCGVRNIPHDSIRTFCSQKCENEYVEDLEV